MWHLTDERLAALADEEPTANETEHLSACAACAAERVAHRRVLGIAALERGRLAPGLNDWAALSTALRAEGILSTPSLPAHRASRGLRFPIPLRVAAGFLLAVVGVGVGRYSAGASLVPRAAVAPVTKRTTVATAADSADVLPMFESVSQAANSLERAQKQYQYAAAFIAENDTLVRATDREDLYRSRLAALDEIAATSRAALYRAPHDPVLNQYYLSTLGAREATLRQLGTSLPAERRLVRY